jgi:hypothetical protein
MPVRVASMTGRVLVPAVWHWRMRVQAARYNLNRARSAPAHQPTSHGARRIHMRLTSRGASCRHGSGRKAACFKLRGPSLSASLSGVARGPRASFRVDHWHAGGD